MATTAQIQSFIELLGRLAVAESNKRIAAGEGFVLPSVCIAQSAIETGWGTAGLMTKANAFFGIKAGGSWTGAVYSASTWEVENGESYNTTANFRAYSSLADSVADYYDLITSLSRYANAVSYGSDRSKWLTANETITAIHKGGYATDTLYVQKIMNTINTRDLTAYDELVTGTGDAAVTPSSLIFSNSDLSQGTTTDAKITNTVSVRWENAKEVPTGGAVTISGIPDGATFELYYKTSAESTSQGKYGTFKNGESVTLNAGYLIAFQLIFEETTTPADLGDVNIVFSYGLPGSAAARSGALAYFVKV